MVNAQYQVTQEQAVTAAINTIRYNGRSNITSSNVEKINTNIVGDFTKVIVVKSNAKNNPKSILRISGVVINNEQLTVEEGKWIK